jgi:hypothetical protein
MTEGGRYLAVKRVALEATLDQTAYYILKWKEYKFGKCPF